MEDNALKGILGLCAFILSFFDTEEECVVVQNIEMSNYITRDRESDTSRQCTGQSIRQRLET